jgi:CRP/FNR family cyclic AMP-dependent transcriptional regulator
MNPAPPDLAALRTHPFGRVLNEPQLERLFRCGTVLTVAPGNLVFHEGEPADRLFLIRSGRVALEQQVTGRAPTRMETLEGGDVLGFSWLFESSQWTMDARAVEETALFALDGECTRREMQADPALGLAIATQLTEHLYQRLQRVRLQRLDVYRAGP